MPHRDDKLISAETGDGSAGTEKITQPAYKPERGASLPPSTPPSPGHLLRSVFSPAGQEGGSLVPFF